MRKRTFLLISLISVLIALTFGLFVLSGENDSQDAQSLLVKQSKDEREDCDVNLTVDGLGQDNKLCRLEKATATVELTCDNPDDISDPCTIEVFLRGEAELENEPLEFTLDCGESETFTFQPPKDIPPKEQEVTLVAEDTSCNCGSDERTFTVDRCRVELSGDTEICPGDTTKITGDLICGDAAGCDEGFIWTVSESLEKVKNGNPGDKMVTVRLKKDAEKVGKVTAEPRNCDEDCEKDMLTIKPEFDVEIQINNTPDDEDDLVQNKCRIPGRTFSTEARIRQVPDPECPDSFSVDQTVTLSSKNGRIGIQPKTLTLPANGDWVDFEITGQQKSDSLNDAAVVAKQGDGDSFEEDATVFWFDRSSVDIFSIGRYRETAFGDIEAFGGPAVRINVRSVIRPTNVNCTEDPISNLQVGIVQNALASTQRVISWSNPTITWTDNASTGDTVEAPEEVTGRFFLNQNRVDGTENSIPLFDRSDNALNPPLGCQNGAVSRTSDAPNQSALTFAEEDDQGNNIATVQYMNVQSVDWDDSLVTWMVIFNTDTEEICLFRQRSWFLRFNQLPTVQRVARVGRERPASLNPETESPLAEDQLQNNANFDASDDTVTFTNN